MTANLLAELLAPAAADMAAVNALIEQRLHSTVPTIDQLSGYIIHSGGKRLRPVMAVLSARACGYLGDQHCLLAAIVEEAAHGTRAIRMDQWRSVTVPVPPESEQQAVAAFLDQETERIDALVAKVRDAIERLKELRIALISAAVTGQIDVREAVS